MLSGRDGKLTVELFALDDGGVILLFPEALDSGREGRIRRTDCVLSSIMNVRPCLPTV